MLRGYRGPPEARRSSIMLPPFKALRWPVYLLWWAYVFLLALSPLPALAQEAFVIDGDGFLPNGCRWNARNLDLNCSGLGLTRVPHIHPNVSGVVQKLWVVYIGMKCVILDQDSVVSLALYVHTKWGTCASIPTCILSQRSAEWIVLNVFHVDIHMYVLLQRSKCVHQKHRYHIP